MADMGGVHFFHVAMDTPKGNWELLELTMDGANKDVDPEGDDRKGGSKGLAKIFLSAGEKNLIALAYVPEALKAKLDIKEWMETVISSVGGKIEGDVTEKNTLRGVALGDGDKNLFPLKMRDTAIGAGFAYLRKKGLVVDEDSDDDVDYGALSDAAGIEW
jgi:hypothetical protein